MRPRDGERGLSLLECAAALALAALVLTSTMQVRQASASLLRRSHLAAETISVARNLLEQQLGMPCAAAPPCPQGYRCTVTRSPVTASADRLIARAEREDGLAHEELRTLAPAPACGG